MDLGILRMNVMRQKSYCFSKNRARILPKSFMQYSKLDQYWFHFDVGMHVNMNI